MAPRIELMSGVNAGSSNSSLGPSCAWELRNIDTYDQGVGGAQINSVEPIGVAAETQATSVQTLGLFSHIRTDLYFIKDEEGGGFLPGSGQPTFYCSFVYDGTQEGPLAEKDLSEAYPGKSYSNGTENAYWDNNFKLGIAFYKSGSSDQVHDDFEGLGADANAYPSARVSGYKMYYSYNNIQDAESEDAIQDSNIYLLYEVDLDKGWRVSGNAHWNALDRKSVV